MSQDPATDLSLPRGWMSAAHPAPLAEAREVGTENWRIARIWTTAGELRTPALASGRVRVLIGVEGRAEVRTSSWRTTLSPGQIMVVNGDQSLTTVNTAPWARFEWSLRLPAPPDEFTQTLNIPVSLSHEMWSVITTVSNTMAAEDETGFEKEGDIHVSYALTMMIRAALADRAA